MKQKDALRIRDNYKQRLGTVKRQIKHLRFIAKVNGMDGQLFADITTLEFQRDHLIKLIREYDHLAYPLKGN